MLRVAGDALLSLLPARYTKGRLHDGIQGGTISGLLEILVALSTYVYCYFAYIGQLGAFAGNVMTSEAAAGLELNHLGFGMGALGWLAFSITPGALLSTFFALEGAARAASAGIARDPCPSLPLWLVGVAHDWIDRKIARSRLAPPAPDSVEFGKPGDGWDLRITAVRPKRDWRNEMTIGFSGNVYEVSARTEAATDDQPPYIYCLKLKRDIGAFRGIVHYNPFEPTPRD